MTDLTDVTEKPGDGHAPRAAAPGQTPGERSTRDQGRAALEKLHAWAAAWMPTDAAERRIWLAIAGGVVASFLLGATVHPLYFVATFTLVADLAMWRWLDTSIVLDMMAAVRRSPVQRASDHSPATAYSSGHDPRGGWREAA